MTLWFTIFALQTVVSSISLFVCMCLSGMAEAWDRAGAGFAYSTIAGIGGMVCTSAFYLLHHLSYHP